MRLKICFLIISLLVFSSGLAAQTEDFETTETQQTIKIIEFGLTGDCEIGAVVDSVYIELLNRKNSRAYVIAYRGTEDLPSRQSDEFLQEQFNWMRRPMAFRKYDNSLVIFVDGGFRKSDSFEAEVWLVPQEGIVPKPTETVEKPKLPKNKTFLADKDRFNSVIYSAQIIDQEFETEPQEINSDVSETENVEETETESNESEETETESDSIASEEETQEDLAFSKYFGDSLQKDSTLKGTIIYYADAEDYDLGKAQLLMQEELQKFAAKFEIDSNRITLVYGGYRNDDVIEYWIVPKGAKEPQPKPEVKKIEVEK